MLDLCRPYADLGLTMCCTYAERLGIQCFHWSWVTQTFSLVSAVLDVNGWGLQTFSLVLIHWLSARLDFYLEPEALCGSDLTVLRTAGGRSACSSGS